MDESNVAVGRNISRSGTGDATGTGQKIDIAQTDTLMSLSALGLIRTLYKDGTAEERASRPSVRIHGVYEAKGGYVAIRVIGEKAINAVAEATAD